jgi:NADPH-dependent 2,4-dienoyl-CoA reductase/sulfur reductase-like enzyme
VVVAGGGVAGLEAARVAALRGHRVTLVERLGELGGQVRLARRAPGRAELGQVADHLAGAVERAGVKICCHAEATVESLLALGPDAVVVATGSVPRMLDIDAGEETRDRLVSARAALEGARLGDRVVVADTKGDLVGLTTADWLAGRRHHVTVVTPHRHAGPLVEPMTWRILCQRLVDQGVEVLVHGQVVRLTDGGVVVRHTLSGVESVLPDVAAVVAACGGEADSGLYHDLRRAVPGLEVHLVGDAAAPRQLERAIFEGHAAGRAV